MACKYSTAASQSPTSMASMASPMVFWYLSFSMSLIALNWAPGLTSGSLGGGGCLPKFWPTAEAGNSSAGTAASTAATTTIRGTRRKVNMVVVLRTFPGFLVWQTVTEELLG